MNMTSVSIIDASCDENVTLCRRAQLSPSSRSHNLMSKASAPARSPARRKGEITRQELMHAAARVFKKHGYLNADVAMITEEAGKARGTFYIYFPSKPDVLRAMIDEFSSDLHGSGLDRSEHEPQEMPTVLTVLWNNYRNHASTFRSLAEAAAVDDGFAGIYRQL